MPKTFSIKASKKTASDKTLLTLTIGEETATVDAAILSRNVQHLQNIQFGDDSAISVPVIEAEAAPAQ